MTIEALRKLLESDALLLYAQPKWTFGQNTCNTYEVFVEKIRTEDGTLIPSREIVDEIERDPELTLLFSEWFLRKAVISALNSFFSPKPNVTIFFPFSSIPLTHSIVLASSPFTTRISEVWSANWVKDCFILSRVPK